MNGPNGKVVGGMDETITFTIDRGDVAALRRTAQAISDYADALEALESAIAGPMHECEECGYESASPQGLAAHGRSHKPAKKRKRAKVRRSHHEWSDAEINYLRSSRLSGKELVAAFRSEFPDFDGTDKAITSQAHNVRTKAAA